MQREKRYLILEWLKGSDARGQIAADIKRIDIARKTKQEECLTISSFKHFYDKIKVDIGDDTAVLAYPVGLALPAPQIYIFPDDNKIIYEVIMNKESVMISVESGTIRRKSNNKLLNIDYLKFIKRLSEEPIRIDEASGLEVLSEMIVQNKSTFELLNVLRLNQALDVNETARDHLEKWFKEELYF